MGVSSRRKGVKGEAEVRRILERAGFTLRGLEGAGDWLAFQGEGPPLHIEVKRAERLKLPEWLRQAADEAPTGSAAVVCFRQNRGVWYAALPLETLAAMRL